MGKCSKNKIFLAAAAICLAVIPCVLSVSPPARQVFGNTLCRDNETYQNGNVACGFADKDISEIRLIPGGFPFGVKFYTQGVIVVGLSEVETPNGYASPADKAGLKKGDIITAIDNSEINSVEQTASAIEQSEGKPLEISVSREGELLKLTLTPVKAQSDGKYKSGMWIRDSTAGIGTVTFIDPQTLAFGGLGHGICDSDTGTLMPMARGYVSDVEISEIIRGIGGRPGELKGDFGAGKTGTLTCNSSVGVFGVFSELPQKATFEPLPIASKQQVSTGKAYIYSCVGGQPAEQYEIEITKINPEAQDCKNFIIKVTDERLNQLTGGIIQGMSGSPIIQNDRLIGAVTHVLVNDPTRGYGIFIENMLAETEKLSD